MDRFLQLPLAPGIVRYTGEPVAVVVAESPYAAEDAAALVQVDYEPLEPVVDARAAVEPGAPILHEAAGVNVAAQFTAANGDIDEAFAEADVVVAETLSCGRHAAVPLEPRGLVAEVEAGTGQLTVWGAAKIVHINRRILADLLGRPEERIRLIELAVGGGFGARGEFYPEDFVIPWLALRLGRPVGWTEDRAENLHALNHSREQLHHAELALRSDGTFLGFRDRVLMNTGAYVRTHAATVVSLGAALLPGPYRWPAFECQMRQVLTNKTPAGTYRGPGRYEGTFVRERMIDVAAHRLGRDPLDLRRQNLLTAEDMPHDVVVDTLGHQLTFDSGDYPLLVDKARERFDYDGLLEWRRGATGPRRRGVGSALFVEKSGIGLWEYARVSLGSDGGVLVHSGITSIGQGVETVLAQICAQYLGASYDQVTVEHGDTATVPDGMGSFGSRATMLAGAAVMDAASALRARLIRLGADLLEAAEADVVLEDGRVFVKGSPERGRSLKELADAGRPLAALRRGDGPFLSEEAYCHSEDMAFPYGIHIAAVEVDTETGAVEIERYAVGYDVGLAVNPQLLEGQIVGGAAQGVGGALLEELVYSDNGQLEAGSFIDYLLPTALEAPALEVLITEDAPTPLTKLGAKGGGEGGTTAAGGAVANAVSDALGGEVLALPVTPQRVTEIAQGGAA
jgi:carbon-monoxide dehydrogenase large subunit/6-hydroxypseudooxynicotine dehydrogenase subunit gamma